MPKALLIRNGKLRNFAYTFVTSFPTDLRVPTGQGKLEKVREFEWSGKGQGKVRGKYYFGKVRENEHEQQGCK